MFNGKRLFRKSQTTNHGTYYCGGRKMKDLIDIIKKECMDNFIDKAKILPGNDFKDSFLNLHVIREVLYSTLMNIELNEVRKKWK